MKSNSTCMHLGCNYFAGGSVQTPFMGEMVSIGHKTGRLAQGNEHNLHDVCLFKGGVTTGHARHEVSQWTFSSIISMMFACSKVVSQLVTPVMKCPNGPFSVHYSIHFGGQY